MTRQDEERPLQFLYEYAVRWNAFSNSAWKLSSALTTFEQAINDQYFRVFKEENSRFRIFKLMTKIWQDVVNDEEIISNLKVCFKAVIRTYHNDILQHIRDKSVRKDSSPMSAVLKKFFSSLIDESINEKSVHYLNSIDIEFDQLFNMFEGVLMKEIGVFVKKALEVGYKAKNLKLVYSVFEEYSSTVKSFIPLKTQKQFEQIKTEVVIKFIRYIL
jgi:hypothetical protein